MAQTLNCLARTYSYYQNPQFYFDSSIWIGAGSSGNDYGGGRAGRAYNFWALDRKNPTAKPVHAVTQDPNTIPPEIAPLLNPNHILIFMMGLSSITEVPQGSLYQTLMANGGGDVLQRLELLNSGLACGVNTGVVYAMIAVPGEGVPGLEYHELTQHAMGVQTTGGSGTVVVRSSGPWLYNFDLILTEGGLYTPVSVFD